MKASREQAERLHAFAEIDRKWQSANQGPDPVSIRPQVIFYAIAFMLTVGWTSVDLWAGNCGTPFVTRFSICSLFGLAACAAFFWAGFSRHNWSVSRRFLVSGAVPVVFPFLVELGRGFG